MRTGDWTTAWKAALLRCLSRPETLSRLGCTREVLHHYFALTDWRRNFVLCPRRAPDPVYACGEILWFMSGSDRCDWMHPYAPSYQERYGEPDGSSYGGYGPRMGGPDALEKACELIALSCDTRRAFIGLWRPEDLAVAKTAKDVPCMTGMQLLVRDGELHAFVNVRSNDAWLGMPYDVWTFSCLQCMAAAELQIEPGELHWSVASLHLYGRYEDKADEAMRTHDELRLEHGWNSLCNLSEARALVTLEGHARDSTWNLADAVRWRGLSDMGRDILACAVRAYGRELPISSPLLRKAVQYADSRRVRQGGKDDPVQEDGRSTAVEH